MSPHPTTPIALALAGLLAAACGDSEAQSAAGTPLGLEALETLAAELTPKDNPTTPAKVELGKQLFFDKRLSSDGSMSCETCHQHALGWSNGERFSTKVGGGENTRNSPALYNLVFHKRLYWDGRAPSLEANIAAAWKGHMNLGEDTAPRAEAIGAIEGYARQFESAFGAPASSETIAKALAAFVRSLRSEGSAWDRYEKTGDASLVTPAAIEGHALFTSKGCVGCHAPPLYTDRAFHAVGAGESDDPGRGKVAAGEPNAAGAFKTPGLRSVAKSAPYFHDGSAPDLRTAVKTMGAGGGQNPHHPVNDPLLKDQKLTDAEVDAIVAFLESLTSTETFEAPVLPE